MRINMPLHDCRIHCWCPERPAPVPGVMRFLHCFEFIGIKCLTLMRTMYCRPDGHQVQGCADACGGSDAYRSDRWWPHAVGYFGIKG